MELLDFAIVALCGLGIGVLSGMFGIGGGGMIVPLLHMAFGLPMVNAAATSLLTIAPTGISGSIKHLRQKTLSLKTGLVIGGFGALASVVSSLFAGYLPEYATVLLTVAVILFSVVSIARTLVKERKEGAEFLQSAPVPHYAQSVKKMQETDGSESRVITQSAASSATPGRKKRALHGILLPLVIGVIAGGIAGIVGVGGGFIIVPFCVVYLGFSLKEAAGTSLVSIALIAIPGILSHALLGHIWWLYGLAVMVGTVPGAQLGALLINRLPERPMRLVFAALLTVIGAMMLVQEFLL